MAKTNQAGADQAPATLEEAVAQISELSTKLVAAESALNTAKQEAGELADSNSDAIQKQNEAILKLEAKAGKSDETIDSLKAELEDAANVIEELKAQVTEAGKGKKKGPVVTIGKKSYLVTGGTVIKQKSYKPEDIAADKELCKKLIEKGSTLLKEID